MSRWSRCGAIFLLLWSGAAEAGGRKGVPGDAAAARHGVRRGVAPSREPPFPRAVDSVTCGATWVSTGGSALVLSGVVPPTLLTEVYSVQCTIAGTPPDPPSFDVKVRVAQPGQTWKGYAEIDGQRWSKGSWGFTKTLAAVPYATNPQSWQHTAVFEVVNVQASGRYTFTITETITAL